MTYFDDVVRSSPRPPIQGEGGVVGPPGPQGSEGPTGPQGPQGPQGSQGLAGPTGPMGTTGSTGPVGATGPQGPQGEAGPQGPQGEEAGESFFGQISRQTSGTVTVAATGAYYAIDLAGTFDTTNANGMVEGVLEDLALKNDTEESVLFTVIGSCDVSSANNELIGMKLAVDGVPIDSTQCRAQTGANNFAKLVSHWMIELAPDEEVSLHISNRTSTQNITVLRAKIVAFTVGREGDTGPQGPQGDTGAQGAQGDTGPQGAQGEVGPQGPQGDTGPQGEQGIQGETGPQGPQGDQGDTGDTGPQGPQGPQGIQGEKGDTGDQGLQGETGPQGPQGETGAQGAEGPQGPQGETGAQGPQGDTGAQGAQGAVGPQGPQGDTGPQGAVGAQGSQGETGAQGDAGPQGETGPEGPQGPQGDTGTGLFITDVVEDIEGVPGSGEPLPETGDLYLAPWVEAGEIVVFGQGVPSGGDAGAVLRKDTSDDYDVSWSVLSAGDVNAPELSGANSFAGEQIFVADDTTSVPVVVRGVAGQTANLFEVQNSAETKRIQINNDGYVTLDGNFQSGGGVRVGTGVTYSTGQRWVSIQNAASVPSTVSSGVIVYSENGRLKVRDGEKTFEVTETVVSQETSAVSGVDALPRQFVTAAQTQVDSSVRMTLFSVTRPVTVSSITVGTADQAASGTTTARLGLYEFDGTTYTLLARTANDTTLFNATFSLFTRSFDTGGGYPASYTLEPGKRYGFALIVSGTTMPRLYGNGFTASAINNLTPRLGVVISGETDLPATSTSTAGNNFLIWGRLS